MEDGLIERCTFLSAGSPRYLRLHRCIDVSPLRTPRLPALASRWVRTDSQHIPVYLTLPLQRQAHGQSQCHTPICRYRRGGLRPSVQVLTFSETRIGYPWSPSATTSATFTPASSITMAPTSHPLLPPLSGSSKALFFNSPNESHMFHEHPTLQTAIRVTLESAGAGLLVSAVQNALDKCVCHLRDVVHPSRGAGGACSACARAVTNFRHDRGAMGIFTRTGGTIGLFGTSFEALEMFG